jgi:glucosamine-6-phosphate deaminase
LKIEIFEDKACLSRSAAEHAARSLREILGRQGSARLVAATGASQFDFLAILVTLPGIDWSRVEVFHLDEYVGLPVTHPASFRKYLLERLIAPTGVKQFHGIDGMGDPETVAREMGEALAAKPVDLLFAGIGENGHLAFNDPPADFETQRPYIVVELDEACRRQQVGEGWFPSMNDVPRRAISMSIRQILKAREILTIAPDTRKAEAVRATVEGEISPMAPASILRRHGNTTLYLDTKSAALLSRKAGTAN